MKILSCFYIFEWCKSKYLNSIYSNILEKKKKKENTRLAFDRDKSMNLELWLLLLKQSHPSSNILTRKLVYYIWLRTLRGSQKYHGPYSESSIWGRLSPFCDLWRNTKPNLEDYQIFRLRVKFWPNFFSIGSWLQLLGI